MYLSLFCCMLSQGVPERVWANAGHPHALVVKAGGTTRRLSATGPPIRTAGAPFDVVRAN